MHNITEMNYTRNKGYWVRFYSQRKLVAHKSFPLGRFNNDWDQALLAARTWRDEQIRTNPLVQSIIQQKSNGYAKKPAKNNKSGTVGVHDSHDIIRGRVRPYSMATCIHKGKVRTSKFYWHNHGGPEQAKALAIANRKHMESLIDEEKKIS